MSAVVASVSEMRSCGDKPISRPRLPPAFFQGDGGVFEGQPSSDGDNRYRQVGLGLFPGSEVNEQGFENLVGLDSFARQHFGGFFAVIGGVMVEFPNLVVDAGICADL